MKGLYRNFPAFAPDYTGVSSLLFDENAITVFLDPHGCNGQSLYYMDPRFEDFSRMPKSFSCGIREKDAVFGLDSLVEKKITKLLKDVTGDYIVLLGTPVPAMLGVDFRALSRKIEHLTNIPTFGIPTTGLCFYDEGQRMFYDHILDWTESGANNFEPEKADVHIIGATPLDGWDYTSMNDYVSLLEDCGITDISCWGQGNLLQKAKGIKNSRLNIAVSAASLHMVERLKQSYGTPYIMGYPIGSLMEKYFKELIKAKVNIQTPPSQPERTFVNTDINGILILGDPINSCMLRNCLRMQFGISKVDIGFCFRPPSVCVQKNDFIFSEEYELKQTISARQEYDMMIGDPLFKSFIPCKKYIDHPNIAVSGRLYASEMDRVFGKWGDAFLKKCIT